MGLLASRTEHHCLAASGTLCTAGRRYGTLRQTLPAAARTQKRQQVSNSDGNLELLSYKLCIAQQASAEAERDTLPAACARRGWGPDRSRRRWESQTFPTHPLPDLASVGEPWCSRKRKADNWSSSLEASCFAASSSNSCCLLVWASHRQSSSSQSSSSKTSKRRRIGARAAAADCMNGSRRSKLHIRQLAVKPAAQAPVILGQVPATGSFQPALATASSGTFEHERVGLQEFQRRWSLLLRLRVSVSRQSGLHSMAEPQSLYCHACGRLTQEAPEYNEEGDRICPACSSDFIEMTAEHPRPAPNDRDTMQVGAFFRSVSTTLLSE